MAPSPDANPDRPDVSRRALLQKAAVGGAIVWVAPGVASSPAFAQGSPACPDCSLSGNLLTNPGAESGDTTGWLALGVDTAATPPGNGSFSFVPVSNPWALSQLVAVSVCSDAIDAGCTTVTAGGLGQAQNGGSLVVEFESAGNTLIGSATFAIPASSGSFGGVAPVPSGTRSILFGITWDATPDDGDFVDDLSFTIS